MRVSFVLIGNQDVWEIVRNRIKAIERELRMEVDGLSITQISKSNLDLDFDSLTSEEIKQGLDDWEFKAEFEVQLRFKEVATNEQNTIT